MAWGWVSVEFTHTTKVSSIISVLTLLRAEKHSVKNHLTLVIIPPLAAESDIKFDRFLSDYLELCHR